MVSTTTHRLAECGGFGGLANPESGAGEPQRRGAACGPANWKIGMNYYNDNDPFVCKWLKELITDGLIPKGDIDDRSILEVKPSDLDGYVQCHFFCGIGGWPYALRLAGWPEDRPVFTGSCPCQPFSVAGKGKGLADERHLWPAFRWLIAQCRPATVFGEQVASKDGRLWLSGVRSDLEAMGYVVGGADLCAAGIGAPHIRQRLWWVADNTQDGWGKRHEDERGGVSRTDAAQERIRLAECGGFGGLANPESARRGVFDPANIGKADREIDTSTDTGDSGNSRLENPSCQQDHGRESGIVGRETPEGRCSDDAGADGSAVDWSLSIWWPCRDGKIRRIPSPQSGFQSVVDGVSAFLGDDWHEGIAENEGAIRRLQEGAVKITGGMTTLFPLCGTVPGRVGLLKGAGNAIVPPLAAEFIKAYMDYKNGRGGI